MSETPIIEIRDGRKEFHGAVANEDINFRLMPAEVHSLLGENGAGKSTMTKIMAGVHQLTAGKLLLDGEEIAFRSPADALSKGIVSGKQPCPDHVGRSEYLSGRREAVQRSAQTQYCRAAIPPVAELPCQSDALCVELGAPSARWWRLRAPCITRHG